MELKTARLTLLIDPNKKAVFERLCATQDRSASQVVRQLIRDYLAQHGVEYQASGGDDEGQAAVAQAVTPAPAQGQVPGARAPRAPQAPQAPGKARRAPARRQG